MSLPRATYDERMNRRFAMLGLLLFGPKLTSQLSTALSQFRLGVICNMLSLRESFNEHDDRATAATHMASMIGSRLIPAKP